MLDHSARPPNQVSDATELGAAPAEQSDATEADAPAPAQEAPPLLTAVSADMRRVWSSLDRRGQQLAMASALVLVVTLLGIPFSTWGSSQFALIVLTSAVITIVTAFLGASSMAKRSPVSISTIEFWASHITAVLALLKLIEVAFNFGQLGVVRGAVGLVVSAALVVAAGAVLYVSNHRGADPYGDVVNGDQGTKVATVGLAIFLLAWAYNVSAGYWSLPALAIAVVTLAALVIAEAQRIRGPVPTAFVGAAIGVFGVILLFGLWGDLLSLGGRVVVLDLFDYLGILVPSIGAVLVVMGGVQSGRGTSAAPIHPTAVDQPAADATAADASATSELER